MTRIILAKFSPRMIWRASRAKHAFFAPMRERLGIMATLTVQLNAFTTAQTLALARLVEAFRPESAYPRGVRLFFAMGGHAIHAAMTASKNATYIATNTHGGAFQ